MAGVKNSMEKIVIYKDKVEVSRDEYNMKSIYGQPSAFSWHWYEGLVRIKISSKILGSQVEMCIKSFPNNVKKGSDSERKEFKTKVYTKHIIDAMMQTMYYQV